MLVGRDVASGEYAYELATALGSTQVPIPSGYSLATSVGSLQ